MTGMFEWKQDYAVGISSIDGQHQNLFAVARELYAAMNSGQGKAAVGRVLDHLVQYTVVHFAHEERLMAEHGYPALAHHREKHAALTRQVLAFQTEYDAGRAAMSVQLLQFLRTWLEHHIRTDDQAYAPFLKARIVA
jgi:hemerythrin-like metal-binding protein